MSGNVPAEETEITVTPEMEAAGWKVADDLLFRCSDELGEVPPLGTLVSEVYRAMESARRRRPRSRSQHEGTQ
jgi:hypothetical protein